jgi:hypothetical protein
MFRLLVVLVVVGLCAWYFTGGSGSTAVTPRPEVRYEQETARATDLEKSLQLQADKQLQDLDAQPQ